ncbi:MAG TPA: carboxypeptidase-like regulatory domain-containing protein [Candidatus Saccharimonadales bacterium]
MGRKRQADIDNDKQDTPKELPMQVPETPETVQDQPVSQESDKPKPRGHFARTKAFLRTTKGKIVASILVLVLVAGVLLLLPVTRCKMLGLVVKKNVSFSIIDSKTSKPVTKAKVTLDDWASTTDNKGIVTFKGVRVGPHNLTVEKKYYSKYTQSVDVWATQKNVTAKLKVKAVGRQVPVKVINAISKKPIENAVITASGASASTNASGEAVLVLPAGKEQVDGTVTLDKYNSRAVKIAVTEQPAEVNTFTLTPAGKIYFLSKRSGNISIMKSNLDGSSTVTVLEGTGEEEEGDTQLLATRDWHYLAFKARRDSDKPKLYLLDTTDDSLTVIDEGNASFGTVGWYNNRFVYTVDRGDKQWFEPKHSAIKSFDATTKDITILQETDAEGAQNDYAGQYFDTVHVMQDRVVFATNWNYTCQQWNSGCVQYTAHINGKKSLITSVKPDGSNKQVLKEVAVIPANHPYLGSKAQKTQELWYRLSDGDSTTFYKYVINTLTPDASINEALFERPATTYYVSPESQYSFWYESRDGKNTLFVGDLSGSNGAKVATMVEYEPIGWFADDYLLITKNGSELYIMARDNGAGNEIKVTDFHKPRYSWPGHGYSYGWTY